MRDSHLENISHCVNKAANYCSYNDPDIGTPRIGSLDVESHEIQPLAFASGTPLSDLYQVIEAGEDNIIFYGSPISRSQVKLNAPFQGRDVLCVGKNYAEHTVEFNSSGFDSSDKVDQPTHPVIFTKRFTSVIADGEEIYPHPGFTERVDYEGEIGVIIGKPGFRISEGNAMDHVWGYTIINDMTARERQRDHKQFYLGKSADTVCPMGPIAVPASKLSKHLRVQTFVNGELRQDSTTEKLIFTSRSWSRLFPKPAGVGIGRKPPTFLQPGDEISVSVTGLGKLTNRIAFASSSNPVEALIENTSAVKANNGAKTLGGNAGLTNINGKPINLVKVGKQDGSPIVFIHGLGGSKDFWTPLIKTSGLDTDHQIYLYDFEGHGLTPTSPKHKISITSLTKDVRGVFDHANIELNGTLIAHYMGCLVALDSVLSNPGRVSKLVLVGPPPAPLPDAASKATHARAALVRQKGMAAVVDAVAAAGTSSATQRSIPMAYTGVGLSLLAQDPEGYAKACTALAEASQAFDRAAVDTDILIITGSEDKVSPVSLCEQYAKNSSSRGRNLEVLSEVGHWHVFEDPAGVAKHIKSSFG